VLTNASKPTSNQCRRTSRRGRPTLWGRRSPPSTSTWSHLAWSCTTCPRTCGWLRCERCAGCFDPAQLCSWPRLKNLAMVSAGGW